MPDVIVSNWVFLAQGLAITLQLSALTILAGTVFGLALGVARFLRVPVLGQIAALYIEFVRGTPLLVVLLICYFGLPALLHFHTTAYRAALLGFVLFIGAYIAEDIRAGLRSVSAGIIQAGLSMGLTPSQVLRFVVLPLAFRRVIPALFNQYVRLFKFTSVASVIGVDEFTASALLVNARVFSPVPIILTVAATYLVLCSAISFVGRALYAHLAVRT